MIYDVGTPVMFYEGTFPKVGHVLEYSFDKKQYRINLKNDTEVWIEESIVIRIQKS